MFEAAPFHTRDCDMTFQHATNCLLYVLSCKGENVIQYLLKYVELLGTKQNKFEILLFHQINFIHFTGVTSPQDRTNGSFHNMHYLSISV